MKIFKKIYALYQKRKRDKFFKKFELHGMKIGYEIEPSGQTFEWLGNNNSNKIESGENL